MQGNNNHIQDFVPMEGVHRGFQLYLQSFISQAEL